MKYVANNEKVQKLAPEMFCVEKKQDISQKFIINFMKLDCVSEDEREEMRQVIRNAREENEKKYMKIVREAFLEKYYTKLEVDKKKTRIMFEDKF